MIFFKGNKRVSRLPLSGLLNLEMSIPSANQFNDLYDSNMLFGYRKEGITEEEINWNSLILASLLHIDLMETIDELPVRIKTTGCTPEKLAFNSKLIAGEIFKLKNLKEWN